MPLDKLFSERFAELAKVNKPIHELAAAFEAPLSEYVSPKVEVENAIILGPLGEIPIRIYSPERDSLKPTRHPGLVWFHGGGFVSGGLDQYESDVVARELCSSIECVVLAVDYRLVNEEIKFPAPQVDGTAASQWFIEHAQEISVDPSKIFIGGASAGASLAASVLLRLRDKDYKTAGGIFIYPLVHECLPPISEEIKGKLSEMPPNTWVSPQYVEDRSHYCLTNLDDPALSPDNGFPGSAGDLSRLPKILLVNAEYDSLRATGERFVVQLQEAGVEIEHHTQQGAVHGYLNRFPNDCLSMRQTLELVTRFVQQITHENE